jgi:lanthanide-dependent methanol dehydrogenase
MRFERNKTVCALGAALALGTLWSAASGDEVNDRSKDPNLWAAPGGDPGLTRHSKLNQINTGNAAQLQMVWSQSSGTLRGHEGQPLVVTVNGKPMMYMESGWPNIIQALDLSDGDHPKEVWNYRKMTNRDESAVPRACCDTVNRGMSFADGKLVFGTLDGYVVALDAVTGKEVWVVKDAWPDKGETITAAPIIADGKVLIGISGDEFGARGRFNAFNLADGSKAWECFNNGTDQDACVTKDTNKKHPEYGTAGKNIGIASYP